MGGDDQDGFAYLEARSHGEVLFGEVEVHLEVVAGERGAGRVAGQRLDHVDVDQGDLVLGVLVLVAPAVAYGALAGAQLDRVGGQALTGGGAQDAAAPKRRRLSRRGFLKGAAGVAITLPALELFSREAQAAGEPVRYVFVYGGISTGCRKPGGGHADMIVPTKTGPGYDVTHGLQPLVTRGIKDEVSIVSGLVLPWQSGPAKRSPAFHYNTVTPQIAGNSVTSRGQLPSSPTSDQLVADEIGMGTTHRYLGLRVQPSNYVGTSSGSGSYYGRMTWRDEGGRVVGKDPIVNPQLAFTSLFSNFTPADPTKAAAAQFALRKRKSVIDLVRDSYAQLLPKLGQSDRLRMTRHFDEIRALETRVDAIAPPTTSSCQLPNDPGGSWPIGSGTKSVNNVDWNLAGYSDEARRADVMSSLIAMAFACDLTRVVSYQLTMWKCYLSMFKVNGAQTDMHECSHGAAGGLPALADGVAWHVDLFGQLVSKLKNTPDASGKSVLDNTAMVMCWEGGHGFDPEGNEQNSSHSTENMCCLVAGGAGNLKRGEHIVAKDAHPGQVVLSAMRATGAKANLGEITQPIASLTS